MDTSWNGGVVYRERTEGVSMGEAEEYRVYADKKSEVTIALEEFKKICGEQGRDFEEELKDCIYDVE